MEVVVLGLNVIGVGVGIVVYIEFSGLSVLFVSFMSSLVICCIVIGFSVGLMLCLNCFDVLFGSLC